MEYPYFRGLEADRYSFYRVPKALVKADLFQKMSGDAKLLYAVLLDRMSLSIKNGWQDKHGNAYIICTIEEVMDSIHCARQKAVKLLDELEQEFRLIERRRQGLGKPNLLYVKDLYAGLSQSNYWKYENHTSGGMKNELPGVPKSNGSNTEKNNKTDNSETDLIYPAELQEEEQYRRYFKEALELEILEQGYPADKAVLYEILELLVETVTSRKKFLRICGEEKPKEVVKSRLMKLDSSHIQYILECLKENSTQIRNIKQYLLATLYNAPVTVDGYHIAVEGHIGTWYAIDETEIGGEKFFLLEHEEHGDMAACVAVNEHGKLVAEDLWNGFDEDFQEAVQKYLSEKWNMPKKEDVVSEIIEKAAPVLVNSAQDYSDVPVYYEPFSYAKENDEVDLYRTSYWLNSECKQAIHKAIADNYDGMYLGDGAVDQVVRQYGMERVGYILANTLHHKSYDGRFSPGNKEWAEQVSTPEHNADRMTFRTDWVVDSHPAILDGFVTMFREELDAQKEQEQPFVKQFYVVENLQAAPLRIERFGNLDDAMSQYQALPNHYMKALGVEKNPDPLPGSLDILQCRNGIDTIVEDYKTVPGWDNPYIQNHVVQPLQGALAAQDVELAYELPDAYFHIQTCDDGFDYTLYNKDFTERDGGILEMDGDEPVQEAMTELLAEFGCDVAEGKVMDAAELREQADTVVEQQAEVLKEKLAAERPAPEETLSFYVAECLEFTFAGEFHDHLTMKEALEAYDKIPSERMNADKCIGFCIEEDGGFVGMYELVVNDKVQRENINSINYFRDDKLVQQAISDMEKLMAARQQSKEQERGSTKKSVLDALRSLKAKKQEQPAQEQDKPKKAKKKGMEL